MEKPKELKPKDLVLLDTGILLREYLDLTAYTPDMKGVKKYWDVP